MLKEDKYEIREYLGFSIIEHENDQGSNSGFQTLFNYISNDNKENQKMSMTVPVIQERTKENKKMAFVVPDQFAENTPKPNNPNLQVKKFDRGLFAVIQYSGLSSEAKELKMNKKLEQWILDKGYKKQSNYMIASYNPPFTLPILRRNEIWVRVI